MIPGSTSEAANALCRQPRSHERPRVRRYLKAHDYRQVLEPAGWVLETFDVAGPTEVELRQLDTVKIHRSFARYSREELAARNLFFVARKP